MKKSFNNRLAEGIVLVEVLLATTIMGLLLPSILNLFITGLESNWFASGETKAQAYSQNQLEALRSVRERGWPELSEGRFCLVEELGRWQLEPTTTGCTEGQFTSWVELFPAYRDDTGGLVEDTASGARIDPSTYRIVNTVEWEFLRSREFGFETYLTRYLDNMSWEQTTTVDFSAGEMDYTKLVEPVQDDGEVTLEGGCFAETPESLIYDDALRNGWRVNCSGLSFWRWLICQVIQFFNNASLVISSAEQTWNSSPAAMKLTLNPPSTGSFWSWARIYNFDGVCTKGFKNLHFYAYNNNPGEVEFNVTAVHDHWDNTTVTLLPGEWTEVSLDYETINEDFESSLGSIYFSKWMTYGDSSVTIYLDQMELTGGVGGYFTDGTLTSSIFDAGRETVFNRVSFESTEPANTDIAFQIATSTSPTGPWLFYGPGGTTSSGDEYHDSDGQGIWLGNNFGRYLRYKAHLSSTDGTSAPILEKAMINYAP